MDTLQTNHPRSKAYWVLLIVVLGIVGLLLWKMQPGPVKVEAPTKPTRAPRIGRIVAVDTDKKPELSASAKSLISALHKLYSEEFTVVSFREFSPEKYHSLNPTGIILSGQGTPWLDYTSEELAPIEETLRIADCPILGICGGHQLLALAFGGTVEPIERLRPGKGYDGLYRNAGPKLVTFSRADDVLCPQPRAFEAKHNHCEVVKTVPIGFLTLASGERVDCEAMRHETRPVYGVQFHPEKWDDQYPEGKEILIRFGKLCDIQLRS